ncbi:hypothetical protein LCGC14_0504120 [marine sediment metagenome]|uniref:Uncharacterized protein n=1 Tax=marine sediment metagenome TaxID=412755 RepID=A0A0F9SLH9_9ZZZZ
MKSNLAIIQEFSKRTGITDPVIDSYIKAQETDIGSIEEFSSRTGITDPKVDYLVEKQAGYTDWDESLWPAREPYDQFSRVAYPRSEARWQWMPIYPNYHMHAAQRDFMESGFRPGQNTSGKFIPRGKMVISGIRAWDDKPLSEAERQVRENRLDKIDEKVSNLTDNWLSFFRGGMRGGFGICEPRRRNYVDGEWRKAPKKLPEPPKKLTNGDNNES